MLEALNPNKYLTEEVLETIFAIHIRDSGMEGVSLRFPLTC